MGKRHYGNKKRNHEERDSEESDSSSEESDNRDNRRKVKGKKRLSKLTASNYSDFLNKLEEHKEASFTLALQELRLGEDQMPEKPFDPRQLINPETGEIYGDEVPRYKFSMYSHDHREYKEEYKRLYDSRISLESVIMAQMDSVIYNRIQNNHFAEKQRAMASNCSVIMLWELVKTVSSEVVQNLKEELLEELNKNPSEHCGSRCCQGVDESNRSDAVGS